jgi:hypothetical protein
VAEPKDASKEHADTEQYDDKKGRPWDADQGNQNKAQDNEPADEMSSPLTSTRWRKGHNLWV